MYNAKFISQQLYNVASIEKISLWLYLSEQRMGDGKTGSTQVVQTSEILKRTKINSVYIFVTTHKKKSQTSVQQVIKIV